MSSALQTIGVLFARASVSGSSTFRERSPCCSRNFSCSVRFSSSSAARRSRSSSPPTTPTTRDASSTYNVGDEYSGAMRTAVCWREVVAPPIRRGSSIPRRSISFATPTISSSDGVIRPETPTMSHASSAAVSSRVSAGTITPRSITS